MHVAPVASSQHHTRTFILRSACALLSLYHYTPRLVLYTCIGCALYAHFICYGSAVHYPVTENILINSADAPSLSIRVLNGDIMVLMIIITL